MRLRLRLADACLRPMAAPSGLGSAMALIALVWLLALGRWWWGDSVVPWDSKNQFYAFFRFLAESLHAGTSTFWNPYHYGGHPSIADPQSLVFSPPFLAWALLDRAPSMRAFDLIVMLHLLVGGLAMAGLGARRGWTVPATVLAACVFMLGAAASARLNHAGIIICYGLFPLALLTLEAALERRSVVAALGFALLATLILLGRNQVALMLCLVLAVLGARALVKAWLGGEAVWPRVRLLVGVAAVVAVLSVVPVLLTLQLAHLSNRPSVELSAAFEASLHPANLASLLSPNVFGSHAPNFGYWGPNWETVAEVSATDDSFNYLFLGTAAAVALLLLGFGAGFAWRRGCRTLTVILIVSLAFSLGRYTPLYQLLFEHVPGFAFFRRPIDALFISGVAVALLLGETMSRFTRSAPTIKALPVALLIAGGVAVLISVLSISGRSGNHVAAAWELARSLPLLIAAGVLLAVPMSRSRRALAAAAISAVTVGELLVWNTASRLNAEARAAYRVLEQADSGDVAALELLMGEVERRRREGARPRVEIIGLDGPWQNLSVVRQLEATTGYNPLRIGIYDRFVAPGEAAAYSEGRRFPATFTSYDCALARALGLEYVVLGKPIEALTQTRLPRQLETLLAGPRIWIYRLPGALPRVRFNTRVEVADVDATTLFGDLLHPPSPQQVVIDDETPPARRPPDTSPVGGAARIVSWQPGRIVVELSTLAAGALVLNDIYYPGWTARLDGVEVPILRADVLFRAVEVPAGGHVVEFRFEPLRLNNLSRALRQIMQPPALPARGLLPADDAADHRGR